ncbi:MAG: FecR domain-containing protein [Nitrospirae bacterium]|nr:FecR domain-containing protein [Nitrospirota bacterium]
MTAKRILFNCYLLVIGLIISCSAVPSYSAEAGAGRITDMSGKVLYRGKPNVVYQDAKKNLEMQKGFWIKTGADGWAVLTLIDQSKLTLSNNTEIELTDLVIGKKKKTGIFSIAGGKIRASVVKLAGEEVDYKVKTPTATAGIKGTEFLLMTQGLANVLFGNEGTVEVSGDASVSKPLTVDTMVQNTRGITPADPVTIQPETPLSDAKKNFEEVTAAVPPKDWEVSNNLPNIIARWNINYGHYLADTGKYEDALYVFQIALDLTTLPEIRSDARLERGAVYARFLNHPETALAEYLLVLEEYPKVSQRETALFLSGMTLYQLGFNEQAKEKLLQYKNEYPTGKHLSNVETILGVLNK